MLFFFVFPIVFLPSSTDWVSNFIKGTFFSFVPDTAFLGSLSYKFLKMKPSPSTDLWSFFLKKVLLPLLKLAWLCATILTVCLPPVTELHGGLA